MYIPVHPWKGYVEPFRSPYGANIIPVVKKDGNVRLCIDYRKLNAKTIVTPFPIQRIDDLLEKFKDAKIYSVIDLKNGYFNVPVRKKDRHKTAFILPNLKLQWRRMPQGLVGAPFTFAELIVFLFEDLGTFVVAYFDDICILSTNAAEHMQHVKIVLERLAKYGMHINKKESQWFKTEVDFLGHRITASGILPVSRKIDEVASFMSPINVSQLRGYLGLFSYYRKFIHKFAEKAAILYDLLKKNTKFVWNDKCEASFQYLKEALTNPELLIYPDFRKNL